MIFNSRSLLLAAALAAAPLSMAMATMPAVNSGPNGVSGDTQTAPKPPPSAAATDPYVKGATGQTVVKGSGSTMAGTDRNQNDAASTAGSTAGK